MIANILTGLAVLALGVYFIVKAQKKPSAKDYDPEISYRLVQDGALLLDTRSLGEYSAGHIEGAVHIAHTNIEGQIGKLQELTKQDKSHPIVVYCQSGKRSGIAKKKLRKLGYSNVINHGGIDSWKK